MPTVGESFHGNFIGLKGENCTFLKIRGVQILEDYEGNNLISAIKNINTKSSEGSLVTILTQRVDALEKHIKFLTDQVTKLSETKSIKGDKGDTGESGSTGPQGPRGKNCEKLQDLTDVDINGIDDGSVPSWSSEKKKFVMVSIE